MTTTATTDLTADQIAQYQAEGFLILRGLFSAAECAAYRQRMIRLETGAEELPGFAIHEPYRRSFNQHLYDPTCLTWLIEPRLHRPLEAITGGPVEAIQTMHFFLGSQHRRHQDQYYLPDCFSAWIPFEDVGQFNGTIFVEPGSHKGPLVTKQDVPKPDDMDYPEHQQQIYFPAVEEVSRQSGIEPVLVEIEAGDVCLFHGRTIHGGAPPTQIGSSRHVLACHYIPHRSERWDRDWPRISFDGSRRVRYTNADGALITA